MQTLGTCRSLVLQKGLPMMHLTIPTMQFCVDPLHIDCQPPHNQQRWLPFHVKVKVDYWSSLHWSHWLLTLSTLNVDPLYIDCWYIDCWSSLHGLLTLSTLTVDPLYIDCWYIDCWPSLHWLLNPTPPHPPCPPEWTEAITFSWKSESWLLILSRLIIDPPPYRFKLSNL